MEEQISESFPLGFSLTDFHMQVSMMFHLMRSCNHPYLPELGLGPGQPRILSYLAVHGTSPQRDIASYFSIDPAAVSRMLDTLGRAGFVRLVPGEDRRRRAVELTEKGVEAVSRWDKVCAMTDEVMLAGFSPDERTALARLLDRVQANMRAHLSRADAGCAPDGAGPAGTQPQSEESAESESAEVRHV